MDEEIKKHLKGVVYEKGGQLILAKDNKVGVWHLLDLRGWGRIQKLFETEQEAVEFHDKLGQFIVDAINEKLETNHKHREEEKKTVTDEEIDKKAHEEGKKNKAIGIGVMIGALWVREKLTFKPCGEGGNVCNCKSEKECGYK